MVLHYPFAPSLVEGFIISHSLCLGMHTYILAYLELIIGWFIMV